MSLIEKIEWQDQLLAYIVRAAFDPQATTFVTPPELNLQLGFVVYPGGGEVARHTHKPLERHLTGTSEVIVVKEGRCEIDVYSPDRKKVATREVGRGDVMLMVAGGHGFRMLEDTVLMEIKQGPYTGTDEKDRF